jgi:hypothetical protein
MNRLTILGTAALVAAALTFPAAATGKHMHHHAHYRTAQPAADAAGAAVGTAGAIATAPFGMANAYGDNYYGAGWNGGRWDQGYSSRNGMACTPGTWIKGDDGRRHVCQ